SFLAIQVLADRRGTCFSSTTEERMRTGTHMPSFRPTSYGLSYFLASSRTRISSPDSVSSRSMLSRMSSNSSPPPSTLSQLMPSGSAGVAVASSAQGSSCCISSLILSSSFSCVGSVTAIDGVDHVLEVGGKRPGLLTLGDFLFLPARLGDGLRDGIEAGNLLFVGQGLVARRLVGGGLDGLGALPCDQLQSPTDQAVLGLADSGGGDVYDAALEGATLFVDIGTQLFRGVDGTGDGDLVVYFVGEVDAEVGHDALHAEDHVDGAVAYHAGLRPSLQHLGAVTAPDGLAVDPCLLGAAERPGRLEAGQFRKVELGLGSLRTELVEVVFLRKSQE